MKIEKGWWLLLASAPVVAALSVASVGLARDRKPPEWGGGSWSYRVVRTGDREDGDSPEKVLNDLGSEGWELVTVTLEGSLPTFRPVFWLKRPGEAAPPAAGPTDGKAVEVKRALGLVRSAIYDFYVPSALDPANKGAARYPTLAELTAVGKVLPQGVPSNPFSVERDPSRVDDADAEKKGFGQSKEHGYAEGAWYYSPSTGKFWAATDRQGECRY